MPDGLPASEFGGGQIRKNIQPHPHVPDASERLSLFYRTGDGSGQSPEDGGVNFAGLYPEARQRALREAEGALKSGEEWQRMMDSPPPPSEAV
jgi:hypothetical protein